MVVVVVGADVVVVAIVVVVVVGAGDTVEGGVCVEIVVFPAVVEVVESALSAGVQAAATRATARRDLHMDNKLDRPLIHEAVEPGTCLCQQAGQQMYGKTDDREGAARYRLDEHPSRALQAV